MIDKVYIMWSMVGTVSLLAFMLLWVHLDRPNPDGRNRTELIASIVSMSMVFATIFTLAIERVQFLFPLLAVMLVLFGISMFVFVSNMLISGLATRLTKKRGENWTKEMEYFYLSIGSVGILGALSRIPFLDAKIDTMDVVAPLLLTVAVVIRFLKTRAEIKGWNKLPTSSSRAPA